MLDQRFDWTPLLALSASTDVGMRRPNNQDSYGTVLASDFDDWLSNGHLLIVADGMGAHAAGELASKMAVDNVTHAYRKHVELSPPDRIHVAITEANTKINERGRTNADFHNMGTTCSTLLLLPQGVVVAHVGDSRIYRYRKGQLHQLTFDHSLVWELQAAGKLSDEEIVENSVPKNVITRSLGPSAKVEIDVEGPFPIESGDKFLLCSDGLTGRVNDEELAAALSMLHPEQATTFLTDLANLRGGPDNITVVIAEVKDLKLNSLSRQLEPLVSGATFEPRKPVNPLLWVAVGVLTLFSLAMFATNHYAIGSTSQYLPIAMGAGAISLIFAAWIGYHFLEPSGPSPTFLTDGTKLGRAPYREWNLKNPESLVRKLGQLLATSKESIIARGWVVNWSEFELHHGRGCERLEAGRFDEVLPEFASAIHWLANECAQRMRSDPSDKWINT